MHNDFEYEEEPTIVEVLRTKRAILYESVYESNGCPIEVLKDFFPDYNYDIYKEYLIEFDGKLYDGDTLKDLLQGS